MTRSTRSLITILSVLAAMAAFAVPAMGESTFVGSPDAIARADTSTDDGTSTFVGTPDAIVRPDGGPSPQLVSSDPSDGFDWGDAGIGSAVGLVLAGLLAAAITITRRRGRTVQPSV